MAGDGDRVRVQGAATLAATLAGAAAQLRALTPVNAEIARYAASRAAALAPVQTGRLRASIAPSADAETAQAGSDLPYAAVQELGWPGHGIEPHRYMARAAADTEPRAIDAQYGNLVRIISTVKGA